MDESLSEVIGETDATPPREKSGRAGVDPKRVPITNQISQTEFIA